MNWRQAEHKEGNEYIIPGNWMYIQYFEAFNILFRIENALRIFVYIVLKDVFNEKWDELNVSSDEDANSTIGTVAKKRISQDNNFAYLGYSNRNPLLYLNSGELIRIITSDKYWKYFKDYFLGGKEIMKNKLDEIGKVRNSLAHFRPIKNNDVALLKQNAEHTLKLIEESIFQLIRCPDVVPSNTNEEWYTSLKTISTDGINFRFNQSTDEKWVKIHIEYIHPIIEKKMYGKSGARIRTTRLKANNLLLKYNNLTRYILHLSEYLPYNPFVPDNPVLKKNIYVIISRNCLKAHHLELKSELENCLLTIAKETELISKDNLARGEIIESCDVTARTREYEPGKFTWDLKDNGLLSNSSINDPPEFWGTFTYVNQNFISDTEEYPWMQVKISEDKDSPF